MSITQILELNKKTGMFFIITMAALFFIMITPLAFAQPVLVSLVQSDACKSSNTCIDLKDLIPLDTTDKKISGGFVVSGDDYIRSKPVYKNHWEFYRYKSVPYVVCVDCDTGFQSHSKKITIESNNSFKYVKQSDHVIVNNTRYEYSNRFIESCHSATVSSDLSLIKDTIQYIGTDCKVPSRYDEKTTIIKPKTMHTDCSYACMNAKFMKDAKAKAKTGFLIQPDIKLKKQNEKVRLR